MEKDFRVDACARGEGGWISNFDHYRKMETGFHDSNCSVLGKSGHTYKKKQITDGVDFQIGGNAFP